MAELRAEHDGRRLLPSFLIHFVMQCQASLENSRSCIARGFFKLLPPDSSQPISSGALRGLRDTRDSRFPRASTATVNDEVFSCDINAREAVQRRKIRHPPRTTNSDNLRDQQRQRNEMAAFGADRDRDKETDKNKGEQVSRMKTGYLPRLVWINGQGSTFKQEFWSRGQKALLGRFVQK
jgi:hypothetical protein